MSQQSLIGKQIDEYKLEALLGEGGMASVYRALDVRLNRYVAVKVIRANFRSMSDYTMRFEREARAVAQLEHPNIITIYRYGEVDSLLYMAMQYVDGADLASVIESYHADGELIEFDEIIRLAHQIGAALDYAHSKGVIHRDIKPQNILITKDGRAIVTDFGLALLTQLGTRGEIFGSPHYIAPEQAISSAGVVPQTDLYALGVMLYEMLTGVVPFDAEKPLDIAMKHMSDTPPAPRALRPELSQDVEDVLLKALEKQPAERYATGKELATALENALKAKKVPTHQPRAQHSILERVALEVAANPLPPLPAPVIQATQRHESPPTMPAQAAEPTLQAQPSNPTIQASANRPSNLLMGGVGILVLIAILLLAANLLNRTGTLDTTPTAQVQAAVVATTGIPTEQSVISTNTIVPSATPIVIATITSNPTSITMVTLVPPTNTVQVAIPPTAAPEIQNYELTIRWNGEDSLAVTNDSDVDFPLTSLTLNGSGSIAGSEWGISTLAPSQCVTAWKDGGNPQPADTTCEVVGTRITRDGQNRFWKASFAVTFAEQRVVCEASPCNVVFTP
jgi:serine/threonine protein kinase